MQDSIIHSPESKTTRIFLELGSNLGDRQQHLADALKALSGKIKVEAVSSIYDTKPVGNTRQGRFLNQACAASTSFTPAELLIFTKEIEKKMGRTPGPVNSPRPIDIDILFYDNQVIEMLGLIIPHPRLTERAFVLVPFAEIAPDFVHPIIGKTIGQILADLKIETGDVVKYRNARGEKCTK
jgi:2-amino-4-hydroxy-6-hydroxymethyldihydropteridine diphosphokinase